MVCSRDLVQKVTNSPWKKTVTQFETPLLQLRQQKSIWRVRRVIWSLPIFSCHQKTQRLLVCRENVELNNCSRLRALKGRCNTSALTTSSCILLVHRTRVAWDDKEDTALLGYIITYGYGAWSKIAEADQACVL